MLKHSLAGLKQADAEKISVAFEIANTEADAVLINKIHTDINVYLRGIFGSAGKDIRIFFKGKPDAETLVGYMTATRVGGFICDKAI